MARKVTSIHSAETDSNARADVVWTYRRVLNVIIVSKSVDFIRNVLQQESVWVNIIVWVSFWTARPARSPISVVILSSVVSIDVERLRREACVTITRIAVTVRVAVVSTPELALR